MPRRRTPTPPIDPALREWFAAAVRRTPWRDSGRPQQAPLIVLLRAWIDAAAAHSSPEAIVAAVESAALRLQAQEEGRLSPAQRYPVPDHLRPLFALPPEEALARVIGGVGPDGVWRLGIAGLTERECQAFRLELEGWPPWEIARALGRRKRNLEVPLPVRTVDAYLAKAHVKLRQTFALSRPESLDFDGAS